MIIFLAAVLDVPQHLYESAELDGAGRVPAAALGDAADDQPGDPVRGRARRDPGAAVLHAGVRRARASRRARPRRPVTRQHARARLSRGLDALLSRCSSTSTGFRFFNMGYASAMAMLLLVVAFAVTLRDHPRNSRALGALRGATAMSGATVELRRRSSAASRRARSRRQALPDLGRRPQPPDRAPRSRSSRRSSSSSLTVADDDGPGALAGALAAARSTGATSSTSSTSAPLWRWTLNTMHLLGPRDARRARLEHPGRVRARRPALARPRRGLHGRARRADAAAAGDGRAAVRDVGEARTSSARSGR